MDILHSLVNNIMTDQGILDRHFEITVSLNMYRIYANLMRTSIFKTLKPKKVFAGECNVHRQKVHSLQQ
jgi:hypothetical protein